MSLRISPEPDTAGLLEFHPEGLLSDCRLAPSRAVRAAPACTTITLIAWATTSCSSRANPSALRGHRIPAPRALDRLRSVAAGGRSSDRAAWGPKPG